jgi:hypothetical protein
VPAAKKPGPGTADRLRAVAEAARAPTPPGRSIDLNAARAARAAARAEADGDAVALIVGNLTLTLPVEMPYEFARAGQAGDIDRALAILLGESQTALLFALEDLTLEDIMTLVEKVNDVYGVSAGK